MSFSSEVKTELCKIEPEGCCVKAETYGLLLFARCFSKEKIVFTSENRTVVQKLSALIAQCAGCIVDIITALSHKKNMGGEASSGILTLTVPDGNDRQHMLRDFGHDTQQLYINHTNMENECCISAFLRGVFLSCGTVTDPTRDYHLEFSAPSRSLAEDLSQLLAIGGGLHLDPGIMNRRGTFVVYLKDSENIADLLTFLGAHSAAMELMQAKMVKEVRNYVNRTTNFETANITKTASAAAMQLQAIQKIQQRAGINSLPEELREVAVLRLENPEMSLRELGKSLRHPISRSGINHRLQRILEIAEKI